MENLIQSALTTYVNEIKTFYNRNIDIFGIDHSFTILVANELKSIQNIVSLFNVHFNEHDPTIQNSYEYFCVQKSENGIYNVVNPKGQVFCSVYMGVDDLTETRAKWIADACSIKKRLESQIHIQ